MKKALKIFGIICVLLILTVIALPFIFKDSVEEKIKYQIHEYVNAQVDFSDVTINLLANFPQASVDIQNLSIINYSPFEGDTLAYAKNISLEIGLGQLFKAASESISMKKIAIDEALVAIKTDSLGNSNLDITKVDTSETEQPMDSKDQEDDTFTFNLEHYEINHSRILFIDQTNNTIFALNDLNHKGDGSFSGSKVILDTHTDSKASYSIDNESYLKNNSLQLDAQLEMDLEKQRYTFLENKALINKLPIAFDGFVQLFEKHTQVDVHFQTPNSNFKNLLALIPQSYAQDLNGVTTSGDFSIDGKVKGKVDEQLIPTLDILIQSHDASFKYPELPKSVSNINMDVQIKNETGIINDTYIKIGKATFRIDQDTFGITGKIQNLTQNMIVDMTANGSLNLGNLNKAYPLELDQDLNGMLQAHITTTFDMQSLEKEHYQNIKSSGDASLQDFSYASPEIPHKINIATAQVNFTPETIDLEQLKMTTGSSDINAKGTIDNMMGFLFTDQGLKGNFNVTSNVFSVSDFMISEEETAPAEIATKTADTAEESLHIPSFLDATLNFEAQKVLYDNLELKNTKGTVVIKDQTAHLKNITSTIFNGGLAFNGNVSTKEKTPTFDMSLDLQKIDIAQSFAKLELLQTLTPIAKALNGNLTTTIKLNGNLTEDLTPMIPSLKGNALAEILNAKVNTTETPLLSKLDHQLNFVSLENLNLKAIKTNVKFDDGKVVVKPFTFKVGEYNVKAEGNHSFEQNLDYKVAVDVPASKMGKEAIGLMSKLDPKEANKMTVALPIGIGGNFNNPKINLNTKQAISELSKQIVAKQKDKVKDRLVGEGSKVLSGLLGGNKKDTDTNSDTTKENITNTAKDVLGGLLGNKKKKKNNNN